MEATEEKAVDFQELMTTKEAAKVMFVDPQTVRTWIRTKKVSAFKVGAMFLIPKSEVDKNVEQRRMEGRLKHIKKGHRLKTEVSKEILAKLEAMGFDRNAKPGKGKLSVLSDDVSRAMATARKTTKLSGHALSRLAGYGWNYASRVEQAERSISDIAVNRFSLVIEAAGGNSNPLRLAFKRCIQKKVGRNGRTKN